MRLRQSVSAAFAILALSATSALGVTWTTLDEPKGLNYNTTPYGISGNTIIGSYDSSQFNSHGFLYNSTSQTWTSVDDPSASGAGSVQSGTFFTGIDGNTIVGNYGLTTMQGTVEHGLLYDVPSGTWTTVDDPNQSGGKGTYFNGISGSSIVGVYYGPSFQTSGFLYNTVAGTWQTLSDPSASTSTGYTSYAGTTPTGVSGNLVVGEYTTADGSQGDTYHGFIYNDSTNVWTTLDNPLAVTGQFYGTLVSAISGNDILGEYYGTDNRYHGFIYDMSDSQWTYLVDPSAVRGTFPTAIQGSTVVGYYWDSRTDSNGFVATLPEPSSVVLFGLGTLGLFALARRRRRWA